MAFSSLAISDGLRVTVKPHSSMMASLASAVSAPPEINAPAWPMRLPAGAVTPAMKPTIGLLHVGLAPLGGFSLIGTTDFADHDDGVGIRDLR